MTIFWHLLLAHLLADFLFHSDKIHALKKQDRLKGVAIHGLVYFICLVICCLPYLEITWFTLWGINFNGLESLPILVLFHIITDLLDTSDIHTLIGINAFMFISWQIIEISFLFLIAPFVPVQESFLPAYLLKLLVIIDGAFFVTYIIMIFIHLLIKDFQHKSYPSFDERFLSMGYHLALYFALLLPNIYAYIFGTLCIIIALTIKHFINYNFLSRLFWLGTILSVIVGILIRGFIYK